MESCVNIGLVNDDENDTVLTGRAIVVYSEAGDRVMRISVDEMAGRISELRRHTLGPRYTEKYLDSDASCSFCEAGRADVIAKFHNEWYFCRNCMNATMDRVEKWAIQNTDELLADAL